MSAIGPHNSTWRSRGSAVAASSASGKCAPVHKGRRPEALNSLSLSFICELRVGLMSSFRPPTTRSFIDGCIRPRDGFLCVEFKRFERLLFRCVQMLEKCCGTAKYCKSTGPSNLVSNKEKHDVCRFEIGGSDLRRTASRLENRALQSTAETAISNHPSRSPGQKRLPASLDPRAEKRE